MTIEIPLTKGKVAIVDDCDADLAEYKWYAGPRYARRAVYADGVLSLIYMHREIAERITGLSLGSDEYVDHVNGDGFLNVRGNLRVCTHQENLRNAKRHIDNQSGYKGVAFIKSTNRYTASITADESRTYLGTFNSAYDAALAYDQAARSLFGEFARLNHPEVTSYPAIKPIRPSAEECIEQAGYQVDKFLSDVTSQGLTVREAADLVGVSRTSISNLLKQYGYVRVGAKHGGYWTRATETEATE